MSMTPTTEEAKTKGQSLDLRDLHAANIARQAEWCPDQVPDLSFRGNELGGECGEAQNVIKKLERERQGWRGSRATKGDLADELADVVICADLCAVTADIDLGAAVLRKFNATSEKQGLSVFLPSAPALAAPRADSAERTAGAPSFATAWDPATAIASGVMRLGWAISGADSCNAVCGRHAEVQEVAESVLSLRVTPAPSSPGVPDSVREALEFYAEQWNADCDAVLSGPGPNDWSGGSVGYEATEDLSKDAGARARKALRTLISANPSGQSTGQGAEEDAEQRITNLANALASARRQRGEQERRAITAEQRIIELEQGKIHPALAVDVQEHRNQAYQGGWDDGYAEGHGKATADANKPAPDSTRTGTVGTEETVAKALYRHDYGSYPDQPEWDAAPASVQKRYRALSEAALAARPEAPSDAGWSREDLEAFVAREWPEGRSAGAAARELVRALGARGLAPTLQRLLTDLLGQINFASTDRAQILADFANAAPEAARMAKIDSFERWNPRVFDPTPPSDPAPSGQAEG